MEIYWIDVTCFQSEACYKKALLKLPQERAAYINGFQKEQSRILSLGAWYLLCRALQNHGVAASEAQFTFNAHGKPRLKNGEFCFNLSHSGTLAVCALSKSEAGIDVQAPVKIKEAALARILNAKEYDFVCTLKEEERQQAALRIFTAKESVTKFLGEDIFSVCRKIEVEVSDFSRAYLAGRKQPVYLREYRLQNYFVTAASGENHFPNELVQINI